MQQAADSTVRENSRPLPQRMTDMRRRVCRMTRCRLRGDCPSPLIWWCRVLTSCCQKHCGSRRPCTYTDPPTSVFRGSVQADSPYSWSWQYRMRQGESRVCPAYRSASHDTFSQDAPRSLTPMHCRKAIHPCGTIRRPVRRISTILLPRPQACRRSTERGDRRSSRSKRRS